MNALMSAGQKLTMSSREIAELVEKRHDNVMRTIEMLYDRGVLGLPQFEEVPNTGPGPMLLKQYKLEKRDTYIVVAQLSPEFTARLVDRWQELETAQAPAPAELSRMDILKLAMESEEARIKAEAERDEAIRTKALIGSKREATAMATAAAKAKEVNRLKHELGRNQLHATVKAVKKMTGIEYDWRAMRKHCKEHGIDARNVVDEQYGSVKAWPAMAWMDVHGIDLTEIFHTAE